MSEQFKSNIESVDLWFKAATSHDLEKILTTLHDDYEYIFNDSVLVKGKEEAASAWKLYLEGLPDVRFAPVLMLSNEDTVAARVRVTATHKGPFRFAGTDSLKDPINASGNKIDYEEASFFTIKDGKILRLRSYWDTGLLRKQMGGLK